VARVELSSTAAEDLSRLIRSHSLPRDTRARFKHSIEPLGRFPRIGPEIADRWEGFRFVLGPWRWMIVVYVFLEDEDRVPIVTIQDGRSSSFAG
jgi:plasmid stabilization system protein ParE